MDQYGIYVWWAYAVAAVVIVVMSIATLRSLIAAQKTLERLREDKD